MLGFKTLRSARIVHGGIELVHMIRKRQITDGAGEVATSLARLFYGLAA